MDTTKFKFTHFIACLAILTLMISCNKKVDKQADTLEIYTVKTDGTNYAPDTMTYYQTTHTENGKIQKIEFYHSNGNLKGIEKYHYVDGQEQPNESKYYGPDDKLLSYYVLSYDKNGNKVMAAAYDGSNDQLLRRETFDYDDKGNVLTKRIKNALDVTQRIYSFKRDAKGNETSMVVSDPQGEIIANERYKITKVDTAGLWIEKYGIVNDVPKTFHVKK